MSDARVGAWIAAWDNLNQVNETLKAQYSRGRIEDPDEYRAVLQMSADIYTHLADVPAEVGVAAAELLEHREKELQEQEAMFRKAFDDE
ncbi:hypothetical protein SEA_SCOTTISH_92 [Mycobacterium phage Scottish]|uniref:Uncharacterized protein n=2 Tax=Cheoctovirus TaxID=1623281 RepID=A0A1J0GWP1_9CAUD|nr:hypothetical protein I5H34_gp092 [Mycobacterium phage Empress]YP_009961501.1 hypothetical protein I5H80_gp096 [Mycobacterium phage Polka14]QEQ94488.1 hypothetical protein SEA_KINGMIDAS_92 [Mycobacterium phage KingMidas]QHB47553.1 hypothetical protein SEA_SCOTTISH_92 [Mycobacterium phage Scottish]APC46668.1 hypothetical protein PBI_EMPRESS_92 [Mycobacterium phage Empress]QCW22174.1 hypothetical protein SEA_POLKA14_96 [Mycobacterium phage Polka14]